MYMSISRRRFIVIESVTRVFSVVFFMGINAATLFLLTQGQVGRYFFLVSIIVSIVPYVIYLKFVRGRLEISLNGSTSHDS